MTKDTLEWSLSKNILTPWQPMRCSLGSFSRFLQCFHVCVCLCVCVSVCVSVHFLSVPFKRPFAPTSQNPMSKMFRDLESLGKRNEKIGFHILKLLFINGVKLPRRNFFLSVQLFWYIFSQKTYFPMDYRLLVEGCIANIGIPLDVFEFLLFNDIFCFKKIRFLVSVLLSAMVKRVFVSRRRDFYFCFTF